jgi:hypothetical protein
LAFDCVEDSARKTADDQSPDGLVVDAGHFREMADCRKATVDGQEGFPT